MKIFYFDPEVWGTVSDWIMVTVTTITAYYLYQTLKSQKEVQETQTKLFEIEKIRFTESIKPRLKFSQITGDERIISDDENSSVNSIRITNDSDNIAFDGSIVMKTKGKNIEIINKKSLEYFHLKSRAEFRLNFTLHDIKNPDNLLILIFRYRDIANNRYIQHINCDLKANGHSRIFAGFPEIDQ